MAALSDSAPAVQNISTAGVAGYVGGYLINLYNVGMLVAGTYAHRFVDVVRPDAGDAPGYQDGRGGGDRRLCAAPAQAADTASRLSPANATGKGRAGTAAAGQQDHRDRRRLAQPGRAAPTSRNFRAVEPPRWLRPAGFSASGVPH